MIAAILRERPRDQWLDLFARARVPAGPIQRLDELATDEALRESGFLYCAEGPDGAIPQVGLGIHFDGRSEGSGVPPPAVGAHTEDILRNWAGCDAEALERLRAQKII